MKNINDKYYLYTLTKAPQLMCFKYCLNLCKNRIINHLLMLQDTSTNGFVCLSYNAESLAKKSMAYVIPYFFPFD